MADRRNSANSKRNSRRTSGTREHVVLRWSPMSDHASVCPLDCPDTCSLTVTVEHAKIVKIRGSRANPYTAGVICTKVAGSYPEWVHGPGRLQTPLRRIGAKGEGRFVPVSWDEALDLIHERVTSVIAAHGPQSVLPLNYAGPHGMLAYASMDLRFFHKLGASLLDRSPLCGGIRTQAWLGTFGTAPGIAPEQVRHSKLIIAWGNNVTWSNLHLTPLLNAARRDGAKAGVADPKRIQVAEQSDLHIALKPRTGAVFVSPKPLAKLQRSDLLPPGARTLTIVDMGRHLIDPTLSRPLKALFVYNHNPLVVHPDQNRMRRALACEDLFTVGCDVVMTDSLAYADVVLPASSHFEYPDLYAAYGQQWLQRAEPVIEPVGESLPNTEIFRRLAARFGFTDPTFTASDADLMDDAIDPTDSRLGGVRPSRLPPDKATAMTIGGEPAVLFRNVFPKTPSGKVELASGYLETKYGQRLPSFRPYQTPYPLILITPASDERVTSTFGGLKTGDATPPLEMHPDDARARGLEDGIMV